MLADIRYWENDATNKHYAIAHFNVWNAEMLMGVIDAAEEAKSPVIISFGTGFVSHDGINGTKSNGAGNNSLGSWSEYGDYS